MAGGDELVEVAADGSLADLGVGGQAAAPEAAQAVENAQGSCELAEVSAAVHGGKGEGNAFESPIGPDGAKGFWADGGG